MLGWAQSSLPPPAAASCSRRARASPRLLPCRAAASDGDQQATPLLDAVRQRGDQVGEVPFHVPGHKRGGSTPPGLEHLLGGALRYDLTELEGKSRAGQEGRWA